MGEMILANGDSYKGEFVDNLLTGPNCDCLFSDGSRYQGAMANSKKEGKGVFTWPSGERYEGEFKNCLRDGYGIYYYADGTMFKGMWKSDLEHGSGVIEKDGKVIEEGDWERGVKKNQTPGRN